MNNIKIRKVDLKDSPSIQRIYSYYVLNTAITFETEVPSIEEFNKRISLTSKNYPYYVLLENDIIVGYAYANRFHIRAAFDYSAELSIYIDKEKHGLGYGKLLINKIFEDLRSMGITNLYSLIASPEVEDEHLDNSSEHFHEHFGFKRIGIATKCGYKFNTWYNMIWMEKILNEHLSAPKKMQWK